MPGTTYPHPEQRDGYAGVRVEGRILSMQRERN